MENGFEFLGESTVAQDVELPKMYKVLLFNDDFTTMDFVTSILIEIFKKTTSEAEALMLSVHKDGVGVAGVYPYDIAATRASLAVRRARAEGFPLRLALEEC